MVEVLTRNLLTPSVSVVRRLDFGEVRILALVSLAANISALFIVAIF